MKIEQKKRWQNFGKHFLEVVSYIAYTVSVYYMSHTYIGKEFIADDKYRLFTFMFIGATFIYFKGNSIEIFKEMIKSGAILIFCQCIDLFMYGEGIGIEEFIYIIVSQIVWQSVSFAFAYLYNSNYKDHGKYTDKLLLICLGFLFVTIMILKWNAFVCIIIFGFIYFSIGFSYYNKNRIERRIEKDKEEKQRYKELKERQDHKRLVEQNMALREENSKLKAKLRLIDSKSKRKRCK